MDTAPMEEQTASKKYQRVLLKISGESLMGQQEAGIELPVLQRVCEDVKNVYDLGVQVALVIGGGNIFRGLKGAAEGIERTSSDHMGMLATVINGLALQSMLERLGLEVRVMSAIPMQSVCEPYIRRRAMHHMQKGRIVICVGGTGNPYFTTDSAAALRASELNCDILMKATRVDGIYSADPEKDPDAKFYPELTYMQVLRDNLRVMDLAAVSLAKESNIPIMVFSLNEPGCMRKAVLGEGRFTLIHET